MGVQNKSKSRETRWRHKKESRKSAEAFEEERKPLAAASLTPRKTGAADVTPSFCDVSARARTRALPPAKDAFN